MRFAPSESSRMFWRPSQRGVFVKPPWNGPLLDSTSLLPTSSSAALTSALLASDPSFHMTTDWQLLPTSDSQYLDHDTQLLPGDHTPLTLAESNTNMFAVSSDTAISNNMNTSMPMMRDFSHSASSSTSPKDRSSSSPEHSYSSKVSSTKDSPLAPEPSSRVEKRKANTLAARRYRQKRVDQMSTLETELKQVKAERDDLKVRNARLEGEVETLRALLCTKK
ncbi:hypothetical protein PTNB73_02601 [Pyrenophora teres f. teres]|nr:hypothetical protein HRS9122_09759 [Pyrenophora teres f. teres]CAA9961688.1 hypothetical protein PTMSG1_05065 [Pyrenophora teres f. maculata]KAE8839385.1 hypothetical protein HRS9139_03768 [Pyrenophora teres f. teres]KAE8845350.1 hypothetical protein PTNB85_03615 [Pyrenophora teres f. teres]KAE8865502.1 hypothetical protein PTNB29_02649 [Pyrenophora teres f. teres]